MSDNSKQSCDASSKDVVQRCPHGISLTAYPGCPFCAYDQLADLCWRIVNFSRETSAAANCVLVHRQIIGELRELLQSSSSGTAPTITDGGPAEARHSAVETKARLTDAQCDEVIDQLQEIEWSGITREDVRTWDGMIAEARCSSPLEPAPAETSCTCPSGDGSLRWPCPAHPPSTARRCHCGKFAMQTGMALITDEHAHDHVFDGMPCDCEDESACSAVEPSPEREPDQLCKRCRHSYAQHTKGLVVDDYCRHCACPGFVAYSPEKASDEGAI